MRPGQAQWGSACTHRSRYGARLRFEVSSLNVRLSIERARTGRIPQGVFWGRKSRASLLFLADSLGGSIATASAVP